MHHPIKNQFELKLIDTLKIISDFLYNRKKTDVKFLVMCSAVILII